MRGFYFDYKILGNETMDKDERDLRINLQRNISAKEALGELECRRGFYGISMNREKVGKTS